MGIYFDASNVHGVEMELEFRLVKRVDGQFFVWRSIWSLLKQVVHYSLYSVNRDFVFVEFGIENFDT